jgi:hypothetical protein
MEIIYYIYRIFMFPNSITLALYSYCTIFKKYKNEIRSNDEHLAGSELWLKVNSKIGDNHNEIYDYSKLMNDQLGILKYVLPAVFWMVIIHWIF